MQTQFWILEPPISDHPFAEWNEKEMDYEVVECAVEPNHRRVGKRLTDLSVYLSDFDMDDFMWTGQNECLIRDVILKYLVAEDFSGFEVRPVKSRFKGDWAVRPAKTWELVVTGWGGQASDQSGVELSYKCPECGLMEYGNCHNYSRLIDESLWDGSDFFRVWPYSERIFVTDRVASFIKEKEITGARLVRVSDYPEEEGIVSPSRLSHCMPEPRARELGVPLGIY